MSSNRNQMPNAIDKISFKAWFLNKIEKDTRIKAHHFDSLLAYFKNMGLKDIEEMSKFEKALRLYFGK